MKKYIRKGVKEILLVLFSIVTFEGLLIVVGTYLQHR